MRSYRTPVSLMNERLDANHYLPEYVENSLKLKSRGTALFKTLYSKTGIGHTASVEPHYDYSGNGVAFVSGAAIQNGSLSLEDVHKVRIESHDHVMKKSQLWPEFLLVVRKGAVGSACVVPVGVGSLNCSSEIMFFKMKPEADAHFLSAFCNSHHGKLGFLRLQRGSIIPGLSLLDIPDLEVYWPDPLVRRYIGDKLRLAERLRERAACQQIAIDTLALPESIKAALAVHESKLNRVAVADLDARLDSKYYGRQAMALLKACYDAGSVKISDLDPKVSNGFEYRNFTELGRPYITVTEVSSGRLERTAAPRIPESVGVPEKGRISAETVLVVRSGSIGTAVKVHQEDGDCVASSDFIRLQFAREEDATAVASFLTSLAGRLLQVRSSYGGVQPHMGQDDLLAIPIPRVVLDAGDQILRQWLAFEACARTAGRLVTAARLLIELLIEGSVTETELIEIQRASEHGNLKLDRELLARLTLNGLDVANSPKLFPDLDTFYHTIESVKALPPLEAK